MIRIYKDDVKLFCKITGILTLVILLLFTPYGCGQMTGDGSWGGGKRQIINAKILSKHVDISQSGKMSNTHYMVTTDRGTFEIENGWIIDVWDADELYGKLVIGKTYNLTIQGDQLTNFLFQQYPFVIKVNYEKLD